MHFGQVNVFSCAELLVFYWITVFESTQHKLVIVQQRSPFVKVISFVPHF